MLLFRICHYQWNNSKVTYKLDDMSIYLNCILGRNLWGLGYLIFTLKEERGSIWSPLEPISSSEMLGWGDVSTCQGSYLDVKDLESNSWYQTPPGLESNISLIKSTRLHRSTKYFQEWTLDLLLLGSHHKKKFKEDKKSWVNVKRHVNWLYNRVNYIIKKDNMSIQVNLQVRFKYV